jgi:hypothetical protein
LSWHCTKGILDNIPFVHGSGAAWFNDDSELQCKWSAANDNQP